MNEIRKPGGLVQRCVVIHRDENGYGLTVSGDNPVYVQSIKENGAAANAGVQVDDQIIKVNGMVVSQSNHLEVVSLIRSGSFVALTLLGKENPSPKSVDQSNISNHRRSVSLGNNLSAYTNSVKPISERASDIERTLNQEREYQKKVYEEYMKSKSPKSQQELADCEIRITALENQFKVLTSNHKASVSQTARQVFRPDNQSLSRVSPQTRPYSSNTQKIDPNVGSTDVNKLHPREETENQNIQDQCSSRVSSPTPSLKFSAPSHIRQLAKLQPSLSTPTFDTKMSTITKQNVVDESDGLPLPARLNNTTTSREQDSTIFDSMFLEVQQKNLAGIPTNLAGSVISMEDYEFDLENENIRDHGPFVDLKLLATRPAHLAVFLHFLMSNSNPSALFFWLVSSIFKDESGSIKDLKRWAYEIYSTFIARNAPLKVDIDELEEIAIEDSLDNNKTTEDRLHSIFDVAREIVFYEVGDQLADFRNKRALGLGGLFGDHQLEDDLHLDRNKELKVIEQTLLPHLETLMADADSTDEPQNDRNTAMASALATFIKQAGLTPGKVSSGRGSVLERCRCFAEKEKTSFGVFKPKRKSHSVNGHQFVSMQYTNLTLCDYCDGLLWGIGTQGYQCQVCEINVHKRVCFKSLPDQCPGLGPKSKKPSKDFKIKQNLPLPIKPSGSTFTYLKPSGYDDTTDVIGEKGRANSSASDPTDAVPDDSVDQHLDVDKERPSTPQEDSHSKKTKSTSLIAPKKQKPMVGGGTLPGMKSDTFNGGSTQTSNLRPILGCDSPPPEISVNSEEELDSDLEVEAETPNWQDSADKKVLKKLKGKEIKRQEVIHELIHTEKTHVRNLKVLFKVFYKPLMKNNILNESQVKDIFPNLEELLDIHVSLLKAMKERSKNEVIEVIGDIMLEKFDGEAGRHAIEAYGKFFRGQKCALERLKKLKETKRELFTFMTKQETHRWCRRLKFTDILASTHQRLSKYHLLLASILKVTPTSHPDYKPVEKCYDCCVHLLNTVNAEMKEAENNLRLEELAKKIEDTRKLDNAHQADMKLDFTSRKLVHEGDMLWRINPNKIISIHAVLLNDMLVILKKEDEKYILKMHSAVHSSLVKLTNIIIRDVATDIKAFYLIKTTTDSNNKQLNNSANLYEFVAHSTQAKKKWVDNIFDTTKLDQYANFPRRNGLASVSPTSPPVAEEDIHKKTPANSETTTLQISPPASPILNSVIEKRVLPSKERAEELTRELSVKDEEIKRILQEKRCIIKELMGEKIGNQSNYEFPSDSRELVLAAMNQANHLTALVNEILSLSKEISASQQANVSVSVYALHEILSSLLIQTAETCGNQLESKSFVEESENFYENTNKSLDLNEDKKHYNSLASASYSDVRKSSNQVIHSTFQSNSLGDIKEESAPLTLSPFKISSKPSTADKTIPLDAEISRGNTI
ncbi:rho guanine nucleotide exchange factor 11 isoform X1 [Hydra vulgaris]|uniref:Rho guanine nucleotide exchange factor 11 n=3 Tax=Hydra vulgaris TaxID=6087 RepID=T2MIK3_HYDVU|nr:rho guanine nucleotide exchange factor 11 isoform X1 [Hydra vulgaris]